MFQDSHDNPGYKKTMDEYFYGKRSDIHYGNISKIIDSVIHQLTLNKDRKYEMYCTLRKVKNFFDFII